MRGVEEAIGAHGEALHPSRQRVAVVGFDDEMKVIVLDGEFHDAKVITASPANRALEGLEQRLRTEAREPAARTLTCEARDIACACRRPSVGGLSYPPADRERLTDRTPAALRRARNATSRQTGSGVVCVGTVGAAPLGGVV
jgi:hypothetical protein